MYPESFRYHAIKARQLLDIVSSLYAEQKYTEAQQTLSQIQDLLAICQQQTLTIEYFREQFPDFDFQYNELTNKHTVSNKFYELTRDQAIQTRNTLLARGFKLFEVKYEGNGIIDWDTKDEPDYLVSLKEIYPNWRIKRSELDPYRFFFTIREGDMTLEAATETGIRVKRLYPNLTIVVYYNDNGEKKSVTINTWQGE